MAGDGLRATTVPERKQNNFRLNNEFPADHPEVAVGSDHRVGRDLLRPYRPAAEGRRVPRRYTNELRARRD